MAGSRVPATDSRVFRAYWQDGVLDLIAGTALVLTGVGWLVDFPLAGVVVVPIALSVWPLVRRRVTEPRLGRVRFDARRRFRMRHGMIAVASLGVLLFGFVAVRLLRGESIGFPAWLAPGIPALLLAALALSAAEALRLARFAAYAAAFVAAALLVSAVGSDPGWAILAGGVLVAANGARLLGAFVSEFPALPTALDE